MKSKVCYAYDPETMIYTGEGVLCENPMSPGTFFAKDYVTEVRPPECFDDEVACWDADKGKWSRRADYRGRVYWSTVDKSRHEITEVGRLPGPYWTDVEPVDPNCAWSDESGCWAVPFEVLRCRKLAQIRYEADRRFAALKAEYSTVEVDSWARQESGARKLQADAAAEDEDVAFVRSMAASRGIPVDELVDKIMAAVQRVLDVSPLIIGMQQRLEDVARAATNEDELDAVVWPEEVL